MIFGPSARQGLGQEAPLQASAPLADEASGQNHELLKQILERISAIKDDQQQHQAAVAEDLHKLDKRIEDAFAVSKLQREDLIKQVHDLAACQNSDSEMIKRLRDRTDQHGICIRESLELLREMNGSSRYDVSKAEQVSSRSFNHIEESPMARTSSTRRRTSSRPNQMPVQARERCNHRQ